MGMIGAAPLIVERIPTRPALARLENVQRSAYRRSAAEANLR